MDERKISLESEKAKLISELESIAVLDAKIGDWVAKPENVSGNADQNVAADATEEWNERRAMVAQLETRYHHVLIALNKIDKDTFGICEVCGDKIETDRMNANLAARTCKIHMEHERELPL